MTSDNLKFMKDNRGLPPKKANFLGIIGGAGYNINRIIGAGIFNPNSIWMIVGSPAVILMFWILGGIISLLGTLIYIELGIRSLPKGIGEQRYIDNAFPTDSYSCAQHLLYLVDINPDPQQYFSKDYMILRLLAIIILAIITGYNMYSNRLSVFINQVLAFIKIGAIFFISLYGLIKLTGQNITNWNEIFNKPSKYVGAYSNGILKVLFVYEDTIEELQEPKDKKLKYSNLISIGVSFILYFLINAAFTISLGHDFSIDESGFNQTIAFNNSIALQFGYKLFNNNEIGAKFMSALVAISAFGAVGTMVFIYARIIKYAALTKFIPKYSHKFDNCNNDYGTPKNALFVQFIYCSIFLLLFFDPTDDLFEFFSDTSQYLAMMFHAASAICLLIIISNNDSDSSSIKNDDDSNAIKSNDDSNTIKNNADSNTIKNNDDSNTIKSNDDSIAIESNDGSIDIKNNDDSNTIKSNDDSIAIKNNDDSNTKPRWIIVIYLRCIIVIYLILVGLIAITSFFPPGPGQFDYYIPYVVSVAATIVGGIIWQFRDYPENSEDTESLRHEITDGSEISEKV
ncbi:15863_t:CDS:10 [Dentiscutata erythropus]|uniref:15863_t:CDS:1 n=1 Tax=Dentiscutata erythropus TaxID=1348616 RepID=A0A9N9GMF6_9GLOM|nr:15863_t:CDS:10 [Dentiscutata erythropus]